MDGLLELIFEDITLQATFDLLDELLTREEITKFWHSEATHIDSVSAWRLALSEQNFDQPSTIFVQAKYAKVGEVMIANPLVRILQIKGFNELAVVFKKDDICAPCAPRWITELALGAKTLAARAQTSKYQCGFEPVTDQTTRLFTGEQKGPIIQL